MHALKPALDEQLLQDKDYINARRGGQVLLLLSLLIGLGLAVLLRLLPFKQDGDGQYLLVDESAVALTGQHVYHSRMPLLPQTSQAQYFSKAARIWQSTQPARTGQYVTPVAAKRKTAERSRRSVGFDDASAARKALAMIWKGLPGLPTKMTLVDSTTGPKNLMPWLKSLGMPEQVMQLSDKFVEGRGLSADKYIKKGTQLMKIPEKALMTASTASELLGIRPEEDFNEWTILATWLAAQRAAGDKSPFAAYIAALPAQCGGVLEWKDGEVEELLVGPPKDEALGRRGSVTAVIPTVLERFPGLGLDETSLRWAFSMLFSRLARLDGKKEGGELALCPWADMLNHKPGSTAYISWDGWSKSVIITADRDIPAEGQVFTSYGEKSSSFLLLSYGFVPPAPNPLEYVDLTIALQRSDPMYDVKKAALARRGKDPVISAPISTDGIPEELQAFAAFAATAVETPDEVERLAQESIDSVEGGASDLIGQIGGLFNRKESEWDASPLRTVAGRELLLAYIQRIQASYPKKFEVDRTLAEPAAAKGASAETREGREIAAAAVRYRDRIVLNRCETVLAGELAELKRGADYKLVGTNRKLDAIVPPGVNAPKTVDDRPFWRSKKAFGDKDFR